MVFDETTDAATDGDTPVVADDAATDGDTPVVADDAATDAPTEGGEAAAE